MSIFNPSDYSNNLEILQDVSQINAEINGIKSTLLTKADSNSVVNLSGTQQINGQKEFLVLPITNLSPNNFNQLIPKGYVDSQISNCVQLTGNQNISGVKTFSNLPESSVVPNNSSQLVNKSYVDSQITGSQYFSSPQVGTISTNNVILCQNGLSITGFPSALDLQVNTGTNPTPNNTYFGMIRFYTNTSSTQGIYGLGPLIRGKTTELWSNTNNGSQLELWSCPNGSINQQSNFIVGRNGTNDCEVVNNLYINGNLIDIPSSTTYSCNVYSQDNSTLLASNFCSVKFTELNNVVSFVVYASTNFFTTSGNNSAFFIRPSSGQFSSNYLPTKTSSVLGLSYNMDHNDPQNDTTNIFGSHQSSVNISGQNVSNPAIVLFGNHNTNTYYVYQFGSSFVR